MAPSLEILKKYKNQTMSDCVTGCKSYYGGEKKHHEDCPYYEGSLSQRYDKMEKQLALNSMDHEECRESEHSYVKMSKDIVISEGLHPDGIPHWKCTKCLKIVKSM